MSTLFGISGAPLRKIPTFAEDPHSPLQRFAVLVCLLEAVDAAAETDDPPPTLRLLLLSKEAACDRRWLPPPPPAVAAVEAAWMLRAERLFCGLEEPRPGKELPRTEEEADAAAAEEEGDISSELDAELISRALWPPPPRPDCRTDSGHG